MLHSSSTALVLTLLSFWATSIGATTSLQDDNLFSINWLPFGSPLTNHETQFDKPQVQEDQETDSTTDMPAKLETLEMVSSTGERYVCTLPTDNSDASDRDDLPKTHKAPHDYLAPIFKQQVGPHLCNDHVLLFILSLKSWLQFQLIAA